MAIDTFTRAVRIDASGTANVSTLSAQFGDGYRQVASAGINSAAETWTLKCNGSLTEMKEVRDFLLSHIIASFWWINPWGEKKLYRVKADSVSPTFPNGGFAEISFVFEQAFAP